MKNRKAPKIKKKIPVYNIGGTTVGYLSGDPNYLANNPKAGMRKSKGFFDNTLSNIQNIGVGMLDATLGVVGAENAADKLYSKNADAYGTKKFGNQWGDLTEKIAPAAAGLVGTAIGGPAVGAAASAGLKGIQSIGNNLDAEDPEMLADGGEAKGKKKIYPTKQDAKAYLENSDYIDNARALLNAELANRLKLKQGQPIPENAILTTKEVGDVLKDTGYDAYYDKVKWMTDYYNKYKSGMSGVAGATEFGQGAGAPIESTAYGAKHRAAKYAKLKPFEESDIIKNKTVVEKLPVVPSESLEDAFGIIGGKKDGGKIVGPGTGKSDSVNAKVKPGSFIVPEENARVAQNISEMYLGQGNKKANLNQGGGTQVKLSDGEFMFSPEQVQALLNAGINVKGLAPNANGGQGKWKGGKVQGYADGGEIKELDQLLKDIDNDLKNAKTAKEKSDLQAKQAKLSEYRTLLSGEAEAIRKYAAGDRSEEVMATLGEVPKGEDPMSYYQQTYSSHVSDYKNDAKNLGVQVKPMVSSTARTSARSAPAMQRQPVMTEMQALDVDSILNNVSSPTVSSRAVASGIPTDTSMLPAPKKQGITGFDPTIEDIISGAQIAGGAAALLSDGSRPVDSLSREYLDTVSRAKTDATYGYDPASLAAYERDIEGARVTGVNLSSQLAGGDAGKALANARAFTNQYAGNLLDLRASDNQLRQQKQKYSDSLINNKVEKERRLFEDKLNAFNINQETGASMLSSGISSLQNAQANKRMEALLKGISTDSNAAFADALINY